MKRFAIPSVSRLTIALFCALSVNASVVAAASQCKGMAQSACSSEAACRWVDGYTRKDGRSVSAHCRLNGGRKAGDEASAGGVKLSAADH